MLICLVRLLFQSKNHEQQSDDSTYTYADQKRENETEVMFLIDIIVVFVSSIIIFFVR